jgi:hypothetical protein
MPNTLSHSVQPAAVSNPEWVALVREKVEGLRYGVVQLVVHDGRVTQIERTEKTRLPSARDVSAE